MHESTKANKTNSVHDKNVKSKCLLTKVTPLYDKVVVLKRAGLALSRLEKKGYVVLEMVTLKKLLCYFEGAYAPSLMSPSHNI
jgi:hypothetical protein